MNDFASLAGRVDAVVVGASAGGVDALCAILPAVPALGVPYAFPPEGPGLPPESISPEQKTQLLAFLQQL